VVSEFDMMCCSTLHVANAPERWWTDANDNDKKNSIVQFKESERCGDEGVVLEFQMNDNRQSKAMAGSKRKSVCEKDDDVSSTTKDLDEEDAADDASRERNPLDSTDASLFETGKGTNRERVSCSAPTQFSQQFSPISIKNSQQSEQQGVAVSDGRQTATFSQIETMKRDLDVSVNLPESEDQNTAASSEVRAAFKSPHASTERGVCSKTTGSKSTTKSTHSSRVSFQPRPKVMLLYPSWTLKAADARCIRRCLCDGNLSVLSKYPTGDELDLNYDFETKSGRDSFMKTLSCHRGENTLAIPLSCYAISTDKDYAMDEGIVVPRSFNYYLAVAMGIPIVDIGFLSTFSSKKRTNSGHQQYPFPYSPLSGKNVSRRAEKKFNVIGASNYSWETPQKAVAASLDRYKNWINDDIADVLLPGTDLLKNYDVILLGEYDQPVNSNKMASKRKKQKQGDAEMTKTRGCISILLQLCGARVYNVHDVNTGKQLKAGLSEKQCDCISATLPDLNESPTLKHLFDTLKPTSNVIGMVKDSSCIKFAEEFLSQYFTAAALPSRTVDQISIVTSDWVLDSIGQFDVKNTA
jgi:hypothetical protein